MGVKRGEIYWCAGPKDVGKVRPWLIVQNESSLDAWPTLSACPLTRDDVDHARRVRLRIRATKGNGLEGDSTVMVDKLSPLPRERIRERIGQLSAADMTRVDALVRGWLGL